jgi:DNA repair protein RadC
MWFMIILIVLIICLVWYNQVKLRRLNQIYADAQVLKKTARATGVLCRSPYSSRQDFLDYMGQFFKFKKHEWIFIAFITDGVVDQFWLNKGPDNEGVSPFISIRDAAEICQKKGFNRILVGHNHPSGALAPSKQDRIFLEEYMDSLAQLDISVEHLVFVAGRWRNYGLSIGQHIRRLFKGPKRVR